MRHVYFVALSFLLLVSVQLSFAQFTRAAASSNVNVGSKPCTDDSGDSPNATSAICSSSDFGMWGTAASGAAATSTYSGLSIDGFATATPENGYTVYASSGSGAQVEDVFTVTNAPIGSYFFIAYSLLATPSGMSRGSVELTVQIGDGNCTINSFGHNSCSAQSLIGTNGTVGLFTNLVGNAGVDCGPPYCGGAFQGFASGFSTPNGAQALVVKVVDPNGNPVKGAVITSASGHVYPQQYVSETALTANPNPSTQGQPVTFTATVSSFGRSSFPTGQVVFFDSTTGVKLGEAQLQNGVGSYMTSELASGTHVIVASYGGDVWSAPSKGSVNQVVN